MVFHRINRTVKGALVASCLAAAIPAAAQAQERVFGTIACVPADGVRFCEGRSATRVRTWDGVPLDVNVTLPAGGHGGFPLILQMGGWPGGKSGLVISRPWARRGYAVLSVSTRGSFRSCGFEDDRDHPGCARGWTHLADSRYEVRDWQHLAGLLVDEGVADPRRIGAWGISYGAGQSTQIALLRDRVRLPDGSYERWRSPAGRPLSIAGAVSHAGWTDLAHSLVPNGRPLDYVVSGARDGIEPAGIVKQGMVSALYALGEPSNYYAPPGVDRGADLTGWFATAAAGEMPRGGPGMDEALRELSTYHSGIGIELERPPAPLLMTNGFTDDLFPAAEAVRLANRVLDRFPGAPVAQLHLDSGHQRSQTKPSDTSMATAQLGDSPADRRVLDWFDHYVKGDGDIRPLRGVMALTQTCPREAASGGPFRAASWRGLHPGEVRGSDRARREIVSAAGNPLVNRAIDPVAGGGSPCATTAADDQPGVATLRLPAARGDGYTLLGAPTVIADLRVEAVDPAFAQVAARLWDVAPDGRTQRLVARALYRPGDAGRQVFQLNPNGWHFEKGHVPKLELLGHDAPFGRPSNLPFRIGVSGLELRLPVRDTPDDQDVLRPASPVLGTGDRPVREPRRRGARRAR